MAQFFLQFLEKEILTLYENNHFIVPYKKNISVFISLQRSKESSFFNGALFAQNIPKELILLRIDYDVALRLENVDS